MQCSKYKYNIEFMVKSGIITLKATNDGVRCGAGKRLFIGERRSRDARDRGLRA